ncbi:MAG TPA: DUF3048 domain-containing protein [Nocardioidaceae bacterium]|nr:DUF3048 domain-containing protein [Nocardioidaceae bacterium]
MSGIDLRTRLSASRRGHRVTASLVSLVLAGSVTLTACGGEDKNPKADGSPDAQGTAAGSTLSGQWPLTGLPAKGNAPKHPVMIVKIDNTGSSRPQVGLSSADLITEELVEGGSTRLAVFFYSQVPKRVGPVRSMRATDIGIVEPADAVLVASGGAPATVRRVHAAGIKVVSEGGTGYSRDNSRPAPYNLFMDLPALSRTLKSSGPPQNYFPWGDAKQFPAGQRARAISATFSGGHTTSWQFRNGKYVNLNSEAAAGDEFRPDTVLVARVKVGDAGYKDPAGNPVPETHFSGSGQAMVFHNGSVVRATWTKKGLTDAVKLSTKAGPLELPPGKVWLELVPTTGGNVTYRK